MLPLKLRMGKTVGANPMNWAGIEMGSHITSLAASSFSSSGSSSLPSPPTPPTFTRASPRTIEKQPSMRLGGFSCLPPSPHLPGLDFAGWKMNHSHSIPSRCPQRAETSPPPLEPACNMGLSGTKTKTFRDPHPVWRARRVNRNNC